MPITQDTGIFHTGPLGRSINVNASGQIVATEAGPLEAYAGSDKGRFIGVDANGKLGITLSSPIPVTTLVASAAFDLADSKQYDITLTQNTTITSFTNPDPGGKYTFIIVQDGTGSRTMTWPANVKWRGGGTAPTLTTTAAAIDVVTMVYRNSDSTFLADSGLDFS